MRKLLLLVPLVLAATACGGGSSSATAGRSHSVLEVSKAFYDAGIQFSGLVTGNEYVTGQVPFLPGKLNSSDLRFDVLAQLSGSDTTDHTGEVVWVFDTDGHAQQAVKQVPLARWAAGQGHVTRDILGNVIVVADGFTGAQKAKLDTAIASLK